MAKQKPKAGATKPRQMRLEPETLANLDLIAAHYKGELGMEPSRTDAVRIAARKEAERIRKLKPAK